MKPLFVEDWEKHTEEDVMKAFLGEWRVSLEELKGFKLLIAYESVGSWGCDSSAWFLLRKGKQLFEVSGSHCSCMGFEDQFSPEPTTKQYLKSDNFSFCRGGYDSNPDGNLAAIKKWISENL